MQRCRRERARVSNDNGDNAIATAARETRRMLGWSFFLRTQKTRRVRERRRDRHTCVSTSGRNSGRAERNRQKRNGKQNYNAAARAWHGTVAIMRFMAAENVVAITSDNGGGLVPPSSPSSFFSSPFPSAAPSAKGQRDDFDSTGDNCRKCVHAHRLESRSCGAFKPTIMGRMWQTAGDNNGTRRNAALSQRNSISTLTLFTSDWMSGTPSFLTAMVFLSSERDPSAVST